VSIIECRHEPAGNGTYRHLDAASRGANGAGNLRQGLHGPLHRVGRDQPEGQGAEDQKRDDRGSGIQSASVIASNNIVETAASTKPIVSG